MFIYEACPAVFYKTLCPFQVGRFILISMLIYNNNVFFYGYHPPIVNV